MNEQLEQLRSNLQEFYYLSPQERVDLIDASPEFLYSSTNEADELLRLHIIEHDIRTRVLPRPILMSIITGATLLTPGIVWDEFFGLLIVKVLNDIDYAPPQLYDEGFRDNEKANEIMASLKAHILNTEKNWQQIVFLAKELQVIVWDWYNSNDTHSWLSDDGTDYFCGALQNLEWLAYHRINGFNLKSFNKYIADAANEELVGQPKPNYPSQACDGEPRYGWLYKIYCAENGLRIRK